MSISEAQPPETFTGVTPPTRRGGSSRQLTDVVVELGFADRETVDRGVEAARASASTRTCSVPRSVPPCA